MKTKQKANTKGHVTKESIKSTADLARLRFTEEDLDQLTVQIQNILSAFESIKNIETSHVTPLVTPAEFAHSYRKDEVIHWKNTEAVLLSSPQSVGQLFKVPPVV